MNRRLATTIVALLLVTSSAVAGALSGKFSMNRVALPSEAGPMPHAIRLGHARPGGGYSVEELQLDDYIAQVLAGEAVASSAPAALDALAITARTFALANRRRHGADGFDLCDLTHCQVVRPATTATKQAARRTAGQVLLYKGAPAQVFYSASCGGRSELPSAVWPGATDFPFLGARHEDSCVGEPPWTSDITERDLSRALRAAGLRGSVLRRLEPEGRNSSGRVVRLRIEGFSPDEISGPDFRTAIGRTLGWNRLRSTVFDVERTSAGFRFTGRGMGHGVGLCVIGSARQAATGQSAESILQYYFPGLSLQSSGLAPAMTTAPPASDAIRTSSRGGLRVTLPALDERDRNALEGFVEAVRSDLARRLGRPMAGVVALRFHPTVESFRRATGQPWWTAASTSGTTIDLLPVAVLRSRGMLESTLRHELAHVATAPWLTNRALWVQEGAAMHFAGEPVGQLRGRVACPRDEELTRAPSPGALRNAYARAGACFSRAIQAGRSWTDVD